MGVIEGDRIESLSLTEEQVREYVEMVNEVAVKRMRTIGSNFNDVDFAMGASVVLFAAGAQLGIPTAWIFSPMTGEAIWDKEDE